MDARMGSGPIFAGGKCFAGRIYGGKSGKGAREGKESVR